MILSKMPFREKLWVLLTPLLHPKPSVLPGWGVPPHIPSRFAFAISTNHNGLKMGQLRYASPAMLDLIAALISAVGAWRREKSSQPIMNFLKDLEEAVADISSLREVVTRDFILPMPEKQLVWRSLGSIEEITIREGLSESIRANHDYLPLVTLLETGSAETLTFVGHLYRAIAYFSTDDQAIKKWHVTIGETHT